MPTLFDAHTRAALITRLSTLDPEAKPRWGQMPARQLPPHLIDALEMCFGEVQYPVRGGFMASGFGRWLVLKLPIPRGRITAPPEFHRTQAGDFAADVTRASDLLERFSAGPDQAWGCSPIFGARSPQQWTRLQWAHTNHHLKQFGC